MKKIFTLVATALMAVGAYAQDVVELSYSTLDQTNSTNTVWKFTGTDITVEPTGGRDISKCGVERGGWANGLNFKNNTTSTIVLPAGVQVYRMELAGFSQGDNWCYLYAYGSADGDWEWTDPIGSGIKDNTTIKEQAKYSLDPCMASDVNGGYTFAAPGYTFAAIDFTDPENPAAFLPYEGALAIQFNGNNQETAMIRLYLSEAAAKEAAAGIEETVVVEDDENAPIYNLAGQQVTKNYKGIVIKKGKKYIVK